MGREDARPSRPAPRLPEATGSHSALLPGPQGEDVAYERPGQCHDPQAQTHSGPSSTELVWIVGKGTVPTLPHIRQVVSSNTYRFLYVNRTPIQGCKK